MKIKKTYMDYMKEFYIGQRAYYIILDKYGYEEAIDTIAENSSYFNIVVIKGDPELEQQQEINNYLKTIKKINPQIKILVYINGKKRPTATQDVKYIVNLKENIDEKIISWLIRAEAKFVFKVNDDDDLEHVNTIATALLIKKNQIYIHIRDNYKIILQKVRNYGYNIFVKLDRW